MNEILKKTQLSEKVYYLKVNSPLIASERKAGQFIILQVTDDGERIPLTIADADEKEGTISFVVQTVGKTSHLLANLEEGDIIAHILGPLGKPTNIEKYGTVVCVGGGIGIAPLYPIAQAMKNAGNKINIILGARTKELIILEENMRKLTDKIVICTDDGSYGQEGLVTGPLKQICESEERPDLVVAIGPPIMMKFCAETTKPYNIKTIVSLNTIMIDGTGMCGGCRVNIGGETKFVCVDGPEFDGHKVDFDNMIQRLNSYKDVEYKEHKECHLKLGLPDNI